MASTNPPTSNSINIPSLLRYSHQLKGRITVMKAELAELFDINKVLHQKIVSLIATKPDAEPKTTESTPSISEALKDLPPALTDLPEIQQLQKRVEEEKEDAPSTWEKDINDTMAELKRSKDQRAEKARKIRSLESALHAITGIVLHATELKLTFSMQKFLLGHEMAEFAKHNVRLKSAPSPYGGEMKHTFTWDILA